MKRTAATVFSMFMLWSSGLPAGVAAEVSEVNISMGYSIGYLPYAVMQDQKLLIKHAKAAGLGDITVKWPRFSGVAAKMDALLSGSLSFGDGGAPGLITLWAKTRDNMDVRGVASIGNVPLYLNTRNSSIKSITDFTNKDRIAVPSIKSSVAAVLLQMTAAKAFGPKNYAKLDSLTVTASNPDAMTAMLSGGEINSHFASPPYAYLEQEKPGVHTVLNSTQILEGPTPYIIAFTTAKFRDANPKTYGAFLTALSEAMQIIKNDKHLAAEAYIRVYKEKSSVDDIIKMIDDPNLKFETAPHNIVKFANFMHDIGSLKIKPASWKDVFFSEIHDQPGD